jgi:diguanylate cyclase
MQLPPMKTVLVIEDEALIRQYLVETLNSNQFRTLEAADGLMGLDLIRDRHPDLILCDIRMPYFDGYDVLKAVRQDSGLATIPFIFLTARASHAEVRQGMNMGADDYLIKPCRSQDLIDAIESALVKRANFSRCYREEVKDQFQQLIHWDRLTDLPNRLFFQEKLTDVCLQMTLDKKRVRDSDKPADRLRSSIAVLAIKVSNYRSICLIFGQEIGDRFLQAVAERLSTAAIPGMMARLSEDNFGVMLEEVGEHATLAEFTHTLTEILNVPYRVEGEEIRPQCGIGISLFPQHSLNPETLLLQADAAMRWCLEQASTGYRFYNPAIVAMENERQLMISDLSRAIKQAQLELHYQPQINLLTEEIIGVEALARWKHPKRGVVPPDSFIPLAEESGLIVALGEWALRSACQQSMVWSEHLHSPISVSVNLSMKQFQDPNLPELVADVLRETRMDPKYLVLELTESCLMEAVEQTIAKLNDLKRLGVKIAIDDFGTGYSSLSYLSQLPIDELKIDQSFVRQLNHDRNSEVIAKTIISMAKSMDLRVVAEGIETQSQQDFLVATGCHIGQGFLYSKSMDSRALIHWFNNPVPSKVVCRKQSK